MVRKTRRARKLRRTRRQRGGNGTRLGFKNGTTIQMLQAKCDECYNSKSRRGFCNLSTCGNYCAIDRTGNYTHNGICKSSMTASKLDPEPYLKGLSRIIIENGIEYVTPEGEISYGDTITSCTTVTIIFNGNYKIALHYNAATYAFGGECPLNLNSMFEQINTTIRKNNLSGVPIKAIYIFGSSRYYEDNEVLLNMNTQEVRESRAEATRAAALAVGRAAAAQAPRPARATVNSIRNLFSRNIPNPIRHDALILQLENRDVNQKNSGYLLVKANGTLSGKVTNWEGQLQEFNEVPPLG